MVILAYLSWTLWLLGDVDQAVARADQAQALNLRLDNAYTRARSLCWDAILRQFVGDWEAVRALADEAIGMATEQGLDLVQATGTIMLGWAQVQEGHGGNGAQQIRQGVEDYRATGASLQMPQFLAALSEAERAHGRSAEGLDVVADALTIVARTGERFFEADLHRLQGELLLDRSLSNVSAYGTN